MSDLRAVAKEALVMPPTRPKWNPAAFLPIRERGYLPPEYLVAGLIQLHGINLFVGDFGSGKTITIGSMLRASAAGMNWAGRKTLSRPVWILDRENPEGYLLTTADLLDIQDGDLNLFQHQFLWNSGRDEMQVRGPDDPDLIEAVKACAPGLEPVIVFDSFRAWLQDDENDQRVVREFWTKCRVLTNARATVIAYHHNNRSGRFSGSTDIGAGVDMFWSVESVNAPTLDVVTFKPIRVRGIADAEFSVKRNLVTHTFDAVTVPGDPKAKQRSAALGELLREKPGLTKKAFETLAADRDVAARDQAREWIKDGLGYGGWAENRGTKRKTEIHWKPSGDVPF